MQHREQVYDISSNTLPVRCLIYKGFPFTGNNTKPEIWLYACYRVTPTRSWYATNSTVNNTPQEYGVKQNVNNKQNISSV